MGDWEGMNERKGQKKRGKEDPRAERKDCFCVFYLVTGDSWTQECYWLMTYGRPIPGSKPLNGNCETCTRSGSAEVCCESPLFETNGERRILSSLL